MAQIIQDIADDLRQNPPTEADKGHDALMMDLAQLLRSAKEYEFHDFMNSNYAAPKIELRKQLLALAQYVVDGKYDNIVARTAGLPHDEAA